MVAHMLRSRPPLVTCGFVVCTLESKAERKAVKVGRLPQLPSAANAAVLLSVMANPATNNGFINSSPIFTGEDTAGCLGPIDFHPSECRSIERNANLLAALPSPSANNCSALGC